ncbi:MAG: hypothetical protein LUJ09_01690 [Firmicutes bacterium]|nr:hypothetical protein [Bacillota bacterium]
MRQVRRLRLFGEHVQDMLRLHIGITSGRIISYTYNSMISLGFIDSAFAVE